MTLIWLISKMSGDFFKNVDGAAEGGTYTTHIDRFPPPGPSLARRVWEWIKSNLITKDLELETEWQKSRLPTTDRWNKVHCGLCGRYMPGPDNPDFGECEHCDRGVNAPSRVTPRLISEIIGKAESDGDPIDPVAIIRGSLGRALAPVESYVLTSGEEVGVWDNGFVGIIPPGGRTDEGIDITKVGDTHVRAEPVDRTPGRPEAVWDGGDEDWSPIPQAASAEGRWYRVKARNPHSGEMEEKGIVRGEDLGDWLERYQ